jgi:hypothetical protein
MATNLPEAKVAIGFILRGQKELYFLSILAKPYIPK